MLIEKLITADTINFEILKEVMDDLNCKTIPELINKLKNLDIVEFVEVDKCVNFELTEKQKEILKNMWNHNISIVLLGKGSGKSTMCCILARYAIFKLLFEDKENLPHNRIDVVLVGSSGSMVSSTLKRELAEQMKKSRIFNMFKDWWTIKRDTIEFFDGMITIHSLNSITSSIEGKNIYTAILDEVSDPQFKQAYEMFQQILTSAFSRFDNPRIMAITWCRWINGANLMADVGWRLYQEYKDKEGVYTIKASHKEVRGKNPKDYIENPDDPWKIKMYDLIPIIDDRYVVPVEKFEFVKQTPLLSVNVYEEDGYTKFTVKILEQNLPKYIFTHIDTSLKKDSTVIALYYDDVIEVHRITPAKNTQISYESLDEAVKQLSKISKVISFDSFNSAYFVEKYNGVRHTFSPKEQFQALEHFLSKLPKIKFLLNETKERLIYEFSHISIDRGRQRWRYTGSGSSDIADSVIYCVFNSAPYEAVLSRKNKKNTKKPFGFHLRLF